MGGLTSQIVDHEDAHGCQVRFAILPDHTHNRAAVPALLEDLPFGALVRDDAFDADWLPEKVERRGFVPVKPPKGQRADLRNHDREVHERRHQVENFFPRIKEFRPVATRHARTVESIEVGTSLAAACPLAA